MDFNRKIDSSKYPSTELPTYPARTLTAHVAMKGIQLGSVAGLVVGVPFMNRELLKWKRGGTNMFSSAWLRVMPVAPLLGLTATLTMLFVKNFRQELDDDGVDDRAFRLINNYNQMKLDQFSVIGAAVGAGAGAILRPGLRSIMASSTTGVVFGILAFGAEHHGFSRKVAAMFDSDNEQ
mmetsp:Transcript_20197/g.33795  ORF Transcript_20197/g.33795 Transcript_20197/m.33795 type:complete len:179 (+) Transcript_20197:58-594(+)